MSEREYIVTLNVGVDYEAFNQEMIASTGAGDIPGRSVDIADARLGSQRNTHYSLTDAEASDLKNDSRVLDVAIPPDQDDNLEIGLNTTFSGTFYKGSSESGEYIDWGKRRHSMTTEDAIWSSSLVGSYDFNLDGSGVDVVIQDSGLQVDHPEFIDEYGVSRVQQIDWYAESGLGGSQSANHYRDLDGHGTHCAGTAAGKSFGWAKNARVYSVKVNGLEGSGDSGTGISISNCFDVIKLWHRNKPIDPVTGQKRPTIVNMSWGYSTPASSLNSVSYRGVSYTSGNDASFNSSPNTHMRDTYGIYPYFTTSGYRAPVRIASVDADVEELIDEGVCVCIAAGNNSFKADVNGGDDYNNSFNRGSGDVFYHRGSSPYSVNAFMVGSLLAQTSVADNKVGFSTTGPGVDIYAAGNNIVSCTSNTNKFTDAAYYGSGSFRQCNISGTSMASPQVCGLGALYLQANPMLTQSQLQEMMHKDSSETLEAGSLTGYGDTNDAMGGPRRVMVSRYTNDVPFSNTLSGTVSITS
tara:strand:+ start:92 stop:1663 length:1572 start_codon:yes stop_codon:yes gene_type:complete